MTDSRRDQIDALNFTYSLRDFTADWAGVRQYAQRSPKKNVVHLPGEGNRRRLSPDEKRMPSDVSQWFLDSYGDDPDQVYARYMRFTMLADVLVDFQQEIREAGLELKDGYCEELMPLLLRIEVRKDQRGIASLSPTDVRTAILRAARNRA